MRAESLGNVRQSHVSFVRQLFFSAILRRVENLFARRAAGASRTKCNSPNFLSRWSLTARIVAAARLHDVAFDLAEIR